MSSAYEPKGLIEDLHELQEEIEVAKAIAEEEQSEREVLVETKSLLVLQSQRHAAELPREQWHGACSKCSHSSYYIAYSFAFGCFSTDDSACVKD